MAPTVEQIIPGYVGMWFMADEAHITAIAVKEEYRRRGIGELLLIGCVELSILRRVEGGHAGGPRHQ